MFLLLLHLVTFFSSATKSTTDQQLITSFATSCTTPNQDEGLCLQFRECAIFRNRNITEDFIQKSLCDTKNLRRVKVCCGKYSDFLNKVKSTPVDIQRRFSNDPFPIICGNQTIEISDRIFGGVTANLDDYPWMARLRFLDQNNQLSYGCAGFLISDRFVLTAAHCFRFGWINILYQVQLGEYNTEEDPDCKDGKCADPPQLLRTENPIIHPEFSNNTERHNDIAIIPLKEPAKLTKYVYPICLPGEPSEETEMWLTGWGKTETADESSIKLKVSIQRADWDSCSELYRTESVRIQKSQLCAGDTKGGDSCNGDSGGPIMVQKSSGLWYAEGIVSYGMGCGLEEWPGVYTSIPHHLPWIKETASNYLSKTKL